MGRGKVRMQEELATVRGIVDLSPRDVLDETHSFMWAQGYTVVERTETKIIIVQCAHSMG